MTALAVAAALGLAGSLPVATLCWAVGLVLERLTRAPRLRETVWTVALALSLLTVAATVAASPFAATRPGAEPAAVSAGVQALVVAWAAPAAPQPGLHLDPAWIAGMVLALAGGGLAHHLLRLEVGRRRLAAVVRRARPVQDPFLLARLQAEAARLGVPSPALLVSDDADRPLLVGLRHAAILLPEPLVRLGGLDRLALIGAHELAHLARHDNLRLVLEEAAAGLLWFNPAFHALRSRLQAAREEVCDAFALTGAPAPVRRLYADTLIHTLRTGAAPEPRTAFTGAARSTAMRLHAILTPPRPARVPAAAAAGVVCLALLAFAGASSVALAQVGGAAVSPAATAMASAALPAPVTAEPTPAPNLPVVAKAPSLPGSTPARLNVRRSVSGPTVTSPPGATALSSAVPSMAASDAQTATEPLVPAYVLAIVPPAEAQTAAARQPPATSRAPGRGFKCPPGGFCMVADQLHVSRANPEVVTYTGTPELYGRTLEDGQLSIDGRPQPAGLDLSTLDPDTIDRVEVTAHTADGRPQTANTDRSTVKSTINVITKGG